MSFGHVGADGWRTTQGMGAVDDMGQVGGGQQDKREGAAGAGQAGYGRHNKREGVDHVR